MKANLGVLLAGFILILPGTARADDAVQQAANVIPVSQLQVLAKDVFNELVGHYQKRNRNGFMDLVSEDFLATDGKRKTDLEQSLEIDFEELYNARIHITSVNQAMVSGKSPRIVTIVANWNRTTDVEINVRRSRWIFEGRSEFKFALETEDDVEAMIEETPEGEEPDFSKIKWDMLLVGLRGDGLFGLTTMEGLLEVVPSTGRGRSLLDGKRVTERIAIGETAAFATLLMNRNATLTTGVTQSFDFSAGRTLAAAGLGDMSFGVVASTFTMNGGARIARVTSASADDFDEYNKDTEPAATAALGVVGGVYLVKTTEGKFAKFLVTTQGGGPIASTFKWVFQENGSGTLSSTG